MIWVDDQVRVEWIVENEINENEVRECEDFIETLSEREEDSLDEISQVICSLEICSLEICSLEVCQDSHDSLERLKDEVLDHE
jgi:hypothetical protein